MYLDKLDNYKEWSPLSIRIIAGFIFIMAGWMKISSIDMFVGMLDGAGFPAALATAWFVAFVELIAGIGLLIGFWTRWTALLLGITMLVAAIMMLSMNGLSDALYPLALLGSMISILLSGAGKLSIDQAMSK
ncbi:DoxX family protein [Candidatus Woesearchaeota archaeon]|nr:DoxX family protein [Candidatus Woesearchaeota archaeon]